MKGRIARLYPPLLMWIVYYIIEAFFNGRLFNSADIVITIPILFLNLQGLNHIWNGFRTINGPWFFTVIMMCYLLVIPYKMVERIVGKQKCQQITIILFLLAVVLSPLGIDLSSFVYFFAGITLPNILLIKNSSKNRFIISVVIILAAVLRVLSKPVFDGSWIYFAIVMITEMMMSMGFIAFVSSLRNGSKRFDEIASQRVFRELES